MPVLLYRRMLRRLEKHGIRKKPSWTHSEFLTHLPPTLPEDKLRIVRKITTHYEKCRFGKLPASNKEWDEMLKCVRQI